MSEHCSRHEENSTDIASLKGSSRTTAWFLGILSGFFLLAVSVLIGALNSISSDIKSTNSTVQQTAINQAQMTAKVEYISQRLDTVERGK